MRSLVTGAAGFVGRYLVKELLGQGMVTAFAYYGENTDALEPHPNLEIVQGDVLDSKTLNIISEVDKVYHLAGQICTLKNRKLLEQMREVNILGTSNIVDSCLKHNVPLVYVSSIEAIAEPEKATGTESIEELCNPTWGGYAQSKAIATKDVSKRSDAVIVFPTAVLGPDKNSLLTRAIGYAEKFIPLSISGGFNWVDVRDVARGIRLAGENTADYFLIYGNDHKMSEVISTVIGRQVSNIEDNAAKMIAFISDSMSRIWPIKSFSLLNEYSTKMLGNYKGISESLKEKSRGVGYSPEFSLKQTAQTLASIN